MRRERRRGDTWTYRGKDPVVRWVTRLANELGEDPEVVASHLDEALRAGYLEWTPRGLRAVIPADERTGE